MEPLSVQFDGPTKYEYVLMKLMFISVVMYMKFELQFLFKNGNLLTAWQACRSYGFTLGIPSAVQGIRFP